jgi:hypothetical protein
MRKLTEEERAALIEARKLEAEEEKRFKEQLFKELNIENHPMRDILYRIAWENGHSSGLHEVKWWADELVELIRLPLIAVNHHEACLIMASIEHKQEQIIEMLNDTSQSRIGIIEGLTKELNELNEIHTRVSKSAEMTKLKN